MIQEENKKSFDQRRNKKKIKNHMIQEETRRK